MEPTFSYDFQALWQDTLTFQGQDKDTDDTDKLAKAKKRVNDAYRKFLSLDWQFLSEFAKLTVEAGKTTYELPDDFATLRTPFILVSNAGYENPIEVTMRQIWQQRSFYPYSGNPSCFALGVLFSEGSGLRYTAEFYPTPNQKLVYNYEYKKVPNILVNDADIPYCPANLSHVLRAYCLAEVEQFDEEASKTWTNQLFGILLPQAIKENSIRTANSVGSMNVGMYPSLHPGFGNTLTINNETWGV